MYEHNAPYVLYKAALLDSVLMHFFTALVSILCGGWYPTCLWRTITIVGMLVIYDWVNIPLVYTQVVAIATYGYFGICLLGRQIHGIEEPDFYVPIFTILQFLFYMGW